MPFSEYVKAFTELGFPVGVAVYLLVYQSRMLERLRNSLIEVQFGLRLILDRLDAIDDYEKAVAEFEAKKERDKHE